MNLLRLGASNRVGVYNLVTAITCVTIAINFDTLDALPYLTLPSELFESDSSIEIKEYRASLNIDADLEPRTVPCGGRCRKARCNLTGRCRDGWTYLQLDFALMQLECDNGEWSACPHLGPKRWLSTQEIEQMGYVWTRDKWGAKDNHACVLLEWRSPGCWEWWNIFIERHCSWLEILLPATDGGCSIEQMD